MKKVILTFIAAVATLSMQAQNINPEGGDNRKPGMDDDAPAKTRELSGWCIDGNIMLGVLGQKYMTNSPLASYTSPVNSSASDIKFNNGMSYGLEVQGGYFFGKKRHWGVGLGLTYLYQTGNVTMDRFHAEYATNDNFGNVYRQEVTATHQVKEQLNISSFNVPLVLKYQTKFSKKVGFTADAGLLFNLHVQNHYNTNAAFDYEAVYRYVNNEGTITTVYDGGATPASDDLLITKNSNAAISSGTDVNSYFTSLRNQGYNVGLNQGVKSSKGNVAYQSGSLGFIIRPAVSIYLRENLALNLGLYYYYQNFNNTASSNYRITNKVGDYSSVLNNVTNASNNSFGIFAGIRYTFYKKAVAAPVVAPLPTPEPTVEKEEPVTEVASPVEVETDKDDNINISTPILFDIDKVIIKESSLPILQEAIKEMKSNRSTRLVIHGYTDNTGTKDYNKKLSKRRAAVVKNYLKKHGVDPKKISTVGHGEGSPAATNKTREGRMRNRRAVIKEKE